MDKFDNYVVNSYDNFSQAHLPKEVIITFLLIIFFIAIISCIFISYKPGSMIIIILSAIPITMDILLREKINLCCSFFMIISIIYSIYKSHKCVIRKKNNNKTFLFKRKKSYLINEEYYKNISVFSSAILLGVTIIILGMSFCIVRPSFIENDRVNEARQQLNKSIFQDKSIEKIFNYFIYGKVSGGINEGRFGNIGEIEYDNSIHLKVALDKRYFNQDIYLKGYVADVYTGNSFKQSPKNDFELNDVLDKSDIFSSEYKFNENMFVFQKNIDANDISLDDICANRGITELTQNEISAFNNMKPEDKSMYIFFEMIRSSIRVQNVAPNDKYLYVPYNSNCNNNINYYKDLCICANKKLQ